MTCIVEYPSKKAFREAVATAPESVPIHDPSIVNERHFKASDIKEGEVIFVTNHPRRSWFANVKRSGGKLKVS
jgi:hypothetical protein